MKLLCTASLWLVTTLSVAVAVNLQEWSHQALEGKNYQIDCSATDAKEPVASVGHTLTWYKHGSTDALVNNTHYSLEEKDGIPNMALVFTPVTGDVAGIYFCNVSNGSDLEGRVVKGINIGGPKYDSVMDQYEDAVIRGVIAGASVAFIVCSMCALDHFRYLTPDQKQKYRDRKSERLARHKAAKEGVDNLGLETAEGGEKQQANGETQDGSTRL